MKIKIISLITVFLFLFSVCFPFIQSEKTSFEDTTSLSGIGPLGNINYIYASDPYDYGFKVGKMYRPLFTFLNLLSFFSTKNKTIEKEGENQLFNLKESSPIFYEEFKGLSDGLDIKIERLTKLASFISSNFCGECTATTCTGKATKNNETFLTFNIDPSLDSIKNLFTAFLFHRIITYKFWVVRIATMKYSYTFWGIPVLYELPILNEKGLGWGSPGTIFTENKSRIDEGPGIPTTMLERLTMMTCKNVSEAADLWKNMQRANQKDYSWRNIYDASTEVFCDKEGGIVVIEQTHSYIISVFRNSTDITGGSEDILWHANHHIWLDPNLTGSVTPEECMQSFYRNERSHELLEENYGNITLETCKEICRDHGGGTNKNGKDSSDICRHPDKNATKLTAYAWIITPKEMTVYWTHRSPCKSRFVKKDFTDIFK